MAAVAPGQSSFELLTLAGKLVAAHTAPRPPRRLAIACAGLPPAEAQRACEAVVAASLAAAFALPAYIIVAGKNRRHWRRSAVTAIAIRTGSRAAWPRPKAIIWRAISIADIKQCTLDSGADHILVAVFLCTFIAHETPWVHIDLSTGNHKGGLAHIPTAINLKKSVVHRLRGLTKIKQ